MPSYHWAWVQPDCRAWILQGTTLTCQGTSPLSSEQDEDSDDPFIIPTQWQHTVDLQTQLPAQCLHKAAAKPAQKFTLRLPSLITRENITWNHLPNTFSWWFYLNAWRKRSGHEANPCQPQTASMKGWQRVDEGVMKGQRVLVRVNTEEKGFSYIPPILPESHLHPHQTPPWFQSGLFLVVID